MEIKKSSKADLESKRIYFFLLGLVVACTFLYTILEWRFAPQDLLGIEDLDEFVLLDEEIEIEHQEYVIPEQQNPLPEAPLLLPASTAPSVYVEIFDVVANKLPVEMPEIVSLDENTTEGIANEIAMLDIPIQYQGQSADDAIYTHVEEMPEFPGGHQSFIKYLSQSIRYPGTAVNKKISGNVICSFIIDKAGRIDQVEVVQSLDPALDRETLRVINNMPAWKPGKNRGKEVMVKFIVPVAFRL